MVWVPRKVHDLGKVVILVWSLVTVVEAEVEVDVGVGERVVTVVTDGAVQPLGMAKAVLRYAVNGTG